MPVKITKTKAGYRVSTPNAIHEKHTTLAKAKSQERLLNAIEHNPNWKPTGKPAKRGKGKRQAQFTRNRVDYQGKGKMGSLDLHESVLIVKKLLRKYQENFEANMNQSGRIECNPPPPIYSCDTLQYPPPHSHTLSYQYVRYRT